MNTDTVAGRTMAERAVDLHERGWSYRRIARKLGIGKSTVFDYVSGEYGDGAKMQEKRELRQALERARLDRVARRADQIMSTSLDEKVVVMAGALLVKVSESRRKLDGLDAPTKVQTTDKPDEYQQMTPEQRIEAHRAAIAEEEAQLAQRRH